jgi:nucleoside-diphosphate-sugar epimerase
VKIDMAASGLILVTGATGAVGPQVVKALCEAGYPVRTLSLDPPPAGIWPEGVEAILGDVTNPMDVRSAMRDVDAVVHLAALLHIVNPPPDLRQKYEKINIGGTAAVVEAAVRAHVKRILYFSTIAVYGESRGRVIDEAAPPSPKTFYEKTKLEAERIVLAAKQHSGSPVGAVLRLGAVYGSRIKGNYDRLTHALAHHRFIPIGNGLNRRTLVYDKDVGRAAVLAVSHPAAAGRVFNVTDGEFHTLNEIIESICIGLGRKPPLLSLPSGMVRSVAGAIEGGCRIFGLRSPITPEMVDKYTEDIAVNGSLIQKELGFAPQYNLQAGWRETIVEMRQIGHLE